MNGNLWRESEKQVDRWLNKQTSWWIRVGQITSRTESKIAVRFRSGAFAVDTADGCARHRVYVMCVYIWKHRSVKDLLTMVYGVLNVTRTEFVDRRSVSHPTLYLTVQHHGAMETTRCARVIVIKRSS